MWVQLDSVPTMRQQCAVPPLTPEEHPTVLHSRLDIVRSLLRQQPTIQHKAMLSPPPLRRFPPSLRRPPISSLFPYTTLFRSSLGIPALLWLASHIPTL